MASIITGLFGKPVSSVLLKMASAVVCFLEMPVTASMHVLMEAEMVKTLHLEKEINLEYYNRLVDQAKDDISKYVDFEVFTSDEPFETALENDLPPWEESFEH